MEHREFSYNPGKEITSKIDVHILTPAEHAILGSTPPELTDAFELVENIQKGAIPASTFSTTLYTLTSEKSIEEINGERDKHKYYGGTMFAVFDPEAQFVLDINEGIKTVIELPQIREDGTTPLEWNVFLMSREGTLLNQPDKLDSLQIVEEWEGKFACTHEANKPFARLSFNKDAFKPTQSV